MSNRSNLVFIDPSRTNGDLVNVTVFIHDRQTNDVLGSNSNNMTRDEVVALRNELNRVIEQLDNNNQQQPTEQ